MTDVFFPVVERDCVWIDKTGGKNATGKKAVVAAIDNGPKLIGLVGEDYKLLHNRDVWSVIAQVISGYDTTVSMYCDNNLARTFFDVRFNDVQCLLGGSEVNFRAIFWNGYAGASLGVYAGGINSFCSNGMITGVYETSWKRHTKGLKVEVVRDWLETAVKMFDRQSNDWRKYVNTPVTTDEALTLFETFDKIRLDDLMELLAIKYGPQYGQTLWSALNCMTDVATHADTYKKRKAVSNTANSTMFSKLIQAEKIVSSFYEQYKRRS